ncbi:MULTISPECIES: hypothetical protein [Streptomyces]|uniref:Uncharacterized protein n=1 Tax=Streptomyces flaveolus TaxID=67297 RepID=A0ABV3ACF5_9ACTN|nr:MULTISPECIES: hypothetical protein [Streptomyces]
MSTPAAERVWGGTTAVANSPAGAAAVAKRPAVVTAVGKRSNPS